MLRTRWRKVLLDLWGHKVRTILVILAIAVGVFSIGFIASAQAILLRELQADYRNLEAASAVLYTAPFDDGLVETIRGMPEVAAAEGRRTISVRVRTADGSWRNLLLTVVADFEQMTVDRLIPYGGKWPPGRLELIVERLSPDYLDTGPGRSIEIELPDGTVKTLTTVGLAFDNRVPSAEITGRGFGYVTPETVQKLGLDVFFTEVRFRVANQADDLAHIQAVTDLVQDKIERSGRKVFAVSTPQPGEHWAEEIVKTLILLFFIFGGVILFLAGFLVINTVSALITQQIQQIGIMKLVGARRLQIMWMYIVMVLLYALIALLIGIPAGIQMGRLGVRVGTELLNVTVNDQSVPAAVIAMQVGIGLLIPLLAALWPVLGGVRITTRQALNSQGNPPQRFGRGWLESRFFGRLGRLPLPRPLLLPLRNTVRRKGRLLLTLLILIMGTALFISVLTVRDSVRLTLDNFLRYHRYDVGLVFDRSYRASLLVESALESPLVKGAEAWSVTGARHLRPDGSESEGYAVVALHPETRLIEPDLVDGRWLAAADQNAVVVNTRFAAEEAVSVGDSITLRIGERDIAWQVVGIVPAPAEGSTKLYTPYEYFSYSTRSVGRANSLQVTTAAGASQKAVEEALIAHISDRGFQVGGSTTADGVRQEFYLRFNIVILFLIVMAVLLAVVGGLGLTTTMSINVLERIREIGVLRAIGASNRSVRQIVIAEGLAVGLLSWLAGLLLSWPVSLLLSRQVGLALLDMPLDFRYSLPGALLWLIILVFLAAAASLGPAQNASRLTIREVLAHD